ncbi:MAG: hypothetical protein KJO65_05205, partial [Gemmatimonadetes bacterium]|nr:hypothetical protein [Gemmatimonadota bacterium]
MRRHCPALLTAIALTALGCSSDSTTEPEEGQLVVRAQAAVEPALAGPALAGGGSADPTSFIIGFYRFYLAENADCSSPVLLEDHGATPENHDLLTNPTLFTVSGTPGTYNCIVMRISDVLTFTSGETFGPCVAGTTYMTDTYRDGEDDWLDVSGSSIVGSGEDSAPVDNQVDVFFST